MSKIDINLEFYCLIGIGSEILAFNKVIIVLQISRNVLPTRVLLPRILQRQYVRYTWYVRRHSFKRKQSIDLLPKEFILWYSHWQYHKLSMLMDRQTIQTEKIM